MTILSPVILHTDTNPSLYGGPTVNTQIHQSRTPELHREEYQSETIGVPGKVRSFYIMCCMREESSKKSLPA